MSILKTQLIKPDSFSGNEVHIVGRGWTQRQAGESGSWREVEPPQTGRFVSKSRQKTKIAKRDSQGGQIRWWEKEGVGREERKQGEKESDEEEEDHTRKEKAERKTERSGEWRREEEEEMGRKGKSRGQGGRKEWQKTLQGQEEEEQEEEEEGEKWRRGKEEERKKWRRGTEEGKAGEKLLSGGTSRDYG